MKPSVFLACAVGIVAIAGCNSKQGNLATNAPAELKQAPPPKGGDWTQVVTETPSGGFIMGNPNAKVKLIEYGSLTCPHCKAFDDEGVPSLLSKYVKSGQVSWEFRNYVRDMFDLTASLIARCNGAESFFPLSRALYNDQATWMAKIQAAPQDQLQVLENLPPNQEFLAAAKFPDFQNWAALHGVPTSKSTACLTDENAINQLIQMTSDATTQFPDFPGTPTFILNGTMLDKTATWDVLEPQIRNALGERG
jgi:protein-disulfide isomerase